MNRAYSSSRWSKRRLTPLARGWRRWRKDIRKLLSWSWTWSCGLSMNRRRGTDVTAVCLWAAGSVKVSLSCDENSVTITNHTTVTCSFVLNTTISAPHDAQITAMCFCQPTDSQTTLLVSTSKDGHFKAWQLAAPAHTEGTDGKQSTEKANHLNSHNINCLMEVFKFLPVCFSEHHVEHEV